MRRSDLAALAALADDPEARAALGAWLTPDELAAVASWAQKAKDAPRRPPKGERPRCPVICPDGHRCRARCWWPKGAEGPEAKCGQHLGAQLAADEPPRKLPDKEFRSRHPGAPSPPSSSPELPPGTDPEAPEALALGAVDAAELPLDAPGPEVAPPAESLDPATPPAGVSSWAPPPAPAPAGAPSAPCHACGALAVLLAQCQRCGCFDPIAGRARPDPPVEELRDIREALALGGRRRRGGDPRPGSRPRWEAESDRVVAEAASGAPSRPWAPAVDGAAAPGAGAHRDERAPAPPAEAPPAPIEPLTGAAPRQRRAPERPRHPSAPTPRGPSTP